MRQWIRLAARCYPRRWRARYGEEFDALLAEGRTGPREFADVVKGAMKMQMTRGSYWKLAAVTAAAGAVIAAALSFGVTDQYLSSAVIRVVRQDPKGPNWIFRGSIPPDLLSRASLADDIQALNLYPEERKRMPMESVVDRMRLDLRIQSTGPAVAISFVYPDRYKAQMLVSRLIQAWPQSAARIEVLEPASLPKAPISPNRLTIVALGLGAGLLAGLLAAVTLRRPKWSLQMAGFAAAGCVLGMLVALVLPVTYTSTAVMRITPAVALPEFLRDLRQEVLSRATLADLVQRPGLELYPEQRAKEPLEDIVEKMRDRDIVIRTVGESAFRISFSYPDPGKAQAVVRELVSRFVERYVMAIPEKRTRSNLEVLDPASLPAIPGRPNRAALAAAGTALGLMLGALATVRSFRIA